MVCIAVMDHQWRRRRGRGLTAAVCAFVLAFPGSALAQGSPDELARRHFDSGAAYLEESDYENALKAFQKAYELSKRPEILLNVATVHERKGDLSGAVGSLKQYLEAAPNGEHVDTVKLRIQNLDKRIAEQGDKPAEAPPPAPAPAAPPPPPPAAAPPPPPPPPVEKPNRVPAYIALGVGGLAAGGALVTGIFAKQAYDDDKKNCSPGCSDDQIADGQGLALTSTILTGVAVVGVGLGVTLWLTATPSDSSGALPPRVRVGLLPQGQAGADATFSF
jgi:hypothetical protein